MKQKNALGKGLASLLSQTTSAPITSLPTENLTAPPVQETLEPSTKVAQPTEDSSSKERLMGITFLPLESIAVNKYQPRHEFHDATIQELSSSIATNGVIQPLIVRKLGSGKYELIAGERRLRASKLAGLTQVPVVVRKSTDKESLELAILENIQRENLNCVDESLAYAQLMHEFFLTLDQVAERMGKDKSTIANSLRILKLPPSILDLLKKEQLTLGHAKAILALESPEKRLYVSNEIINKKLSVRQTESLVHSLAATPGASPKGGTDSGGPDNKDRGIIYNRLQELSSKVTGALSAKAEIKGSEKRGKIVIHYTSKAELERIATALQKEPHV